MVWLLPLQLSGLCLALSIHLDLPGFFLIKTKPFARLIPSLTKSRDWCAASHFLHLLVVERYLGVKVTLTSLSAKCQPHHVSPWEMGRPQEAFLNLWEALPCFTLRSHRHSPHCSGTAGLIVPFGLLVLFGLSQRCAPSGARNTGVAGTGLDLPDVAAFFRFLFTGHRRVQRNLLERFLGVTEDCRRFPPAQ